MNYNRYPSTATFEGTYTIGNDNKIKTSNIDNKYSWPYHDTYENASLREGNQIAILMQDCGYAVGMNYNIEGSGATTINAAIALVDISKANGV